MSPLDSFKDRMKFCDLLISAGGKVNSSMRIWKLKEKVRVHLEVEIDIDPSTYEVCQDLHLDEVLRKQVKDKGVVY